MLILFVFYDFSVHIDEKSDEKDCPSNLSEICNKALDGIVLITTADGDIIFISENVSTYLGLSQVRSENSLINCNLCLVVWVNINILFVDVCSYLVVPKKF